MTQATIRLFVSDMDSTMIANECIDEMARMLDEKKPIADATPVSLAPCSMAATRTRATWTSSRTPSARPPLMNGRPSR